MAITPNNAMDEEWHFKRNDDNEKWLEMRRFVEWSVAPMRIQYNQHMYFLYAHPEEAKSWNLKCIEKMARAEGVEIVRGMGMRWMTNSSAVAEMIERMFANGEEWHHRRLGEEFGERMSEELFQALMQQMRNDGRIRDGEIGAVVPTDEEGLRWIFNLGWNGDEEFYDDISGEKLDPELVRRAREEEMEEVRKHGLYEKRTIEECMRMTGKKPIGVRWVDVNKGDSVNPDYRSRLVAKEIKVNKREDLFAATPPLEAKKLLFSMAVTEGIGVRRGMRRSGGCCS